MACEDASFTHCYAWYFREKKNMAGPNHRNFQRYVGLPCLVDADCFTKCRKPALASLQEGLFFFLAESPGYFTMRTFVVGFIYNNEIVSGIYRIFDVYPLVM